MRKQAERWEVRKFTTSFDHKPTGDEEVLCNTFLSYETACFWTKGYMASLWEHAGWGKSNRAEDTLIDPERRRLHVFTVRKCEEN